jgi:hypothetical protein
LDALLLKADLERSGRAVDCTGLENRRSFTGSGGSNPPSSANELRQAQGFLGLFCFSGRTIENKVFSEGEQKNKKRAERAALIHSTLPRKGSPVGNPPSSARKACLAAGFFFKVNVSDSEGGFERRAGGFELRAGTCGCSHEWRCGMHVRTSNPPSSANELRQAQGFLGLLFLSNLRQLVLVYAPQAVFVYIQPHPLSLS